MAQFIQRSHEDRNATGDELISGLLASTPFISPKFLYDTLGSKLFEAICELPEYYPTRTEAAIFNAHAHDIVRAVGADVTLIDLGAGNCAKAARLFPLLHPAQYVALDISVEFLRGAVDRLQLQFPHIEMTGIGIDFSSSLDLPDIVRNDKRLFFYPGSSIGNFTPDEAGSFLQRLFRACRDGGSSNGGILIGVDLVKQSGILDAAYDDALGVTAAFNLNLLLHLNHLIGADFDVRDWQHIGFFNQESSRVEMHLEAKYAVTVHWDGGYRHFELGERIHTENSYKYTKDDFVDMLEGAGFHQVGTWTDANGWFMVCHAHAG